MLWHIYVVEDGECIRLTEEPYDSEQVALAIDQLGSAQVITLIPAEPLAAAA